jgi:glycosyltransferase involved in cell wall biosynthesis
MNTVLVLSKYYVPAYKAGGPIRSIKNIISNLSSEFDFKVITGDRDSDDDEPFSDVKINSWNEVGDAEVYYCSLGSQSPVGLWKIARDTEYDAVYVNSIFEPWFGIQPQLLWRFSLLRNVPLILAPRGEFSPGAIKQSKYKKYTYLSIFKYFSIHQDVIWHASTKREVREIHEWVGEDVSIRVAQNIPSLIEVDGENVSVDQSSLDLVYLSRITPKKNLHYALELLSGANANINFNIYGVISDKRYWQKCCDIIKKLPEYINVCYKGPVPHTEVGKVFSAHDAFLFPTRGENYGHVIFEALSSGCPVLLSDQTPWGSIQKEEAGWVLPLSDRVGFRNAIQTCADAEKEDWEHWSTQARKLARKVLHDSEIIESNRRLFHEAIER